MFFAHVHMKDYLPWADTKSDVSVEPYQTSIYMKEYLATKGTKKLLWLKNSSELEAYLSKHLSSQMKTDEILETYLLNQWVPVLPGWFVTYRLDSPQS